MHAQFSTLFERCHPNVNPHRLHKDMCDACMRAQIMPSGSGLTQEERASIKKSLAIQIDAARTRRRHIADVVEAVVKANDSKQEHVATINPGVVSTAEIDGDQPKRSDLGCPRPSGSPRSSRWRTTAATSAGRPTTTRDQAQTFA